MKPILENEAMVILIVVVAVALIVLALRIIAERYAKGKVAIIMLAVEKRLATWVLSQASGPEKKEAAEFLVKHYYKNLPAFVRVFISEAEAVKYIESAYDQMLKLVGEVTPVEEIPTKSHPTD